jgi:lysophospholipase L1-like esterase
LKLDEALTRRLRPSSMTLGMKIQLRITRNTTSVIILLAFLCGNLLAGPTNSLSTHKSARWEPVIRVFEAKDKTNPPPKGCIVFAGSSSIRLWTNLATTFPGFPVINRGFGGSQLADSANFADRIIIPYAPRQVVIYAGGNDINAGKDPEVVFGDFVALATRIRERLPGTQIAFISSAPNPQRWAQVEKVKRLNELVRAYCQAEDLAFIDVFPLMLGPDGQPKPDIFIQDRLHMNQKGYAIWKEAVGPYLRKP